MGLDMTVLIVDWDHLRAEPADRRLDLLQDAAYTDEPAGPGADWFAAYDFPGSTGSYKPHFWTGEAWEDVREFASPALRDALDRITLALFWPGPTGDAEHVEPGVIPGPGLLIAQNPDAVAVLADAWDFAREHLHELRSPFEEHAAAPNRWVGTFAEFSAMLQAWGEALTEASRRRWGIIGIP